MLNDAYAGKSLNPPQKLEEVLPTHTDTKVALNNFSIFFLLSICVAGPFESFPSLLTTPHFPAPPSWGSPLTAQALFFTQQGKRKVR